MPGGSLTLEDYPGDLVELACRRCDRRGRLRKDRLIERYGSEKRLPDLKAELARCPKEGNYGDGCGAHFPALLPTP